MSGLCTQVFVYCLLTQPSSCFWSTFGKTFCKELNNWVCVLIYFIIFVQICLFLLSILLSLSLPRQLPIQQKTFCEKFSGFDLTPDKNHEYLKALKKDKKTFEMEEKHNFRREPWSSGYGWRLMFQRSWVRIPAPYTGWTFFHIYLL